MSDQHFAKRLAGAMKKAGFTQEDLAKGVGVSQPAVSRWLKGSLPDLARGIRLSTILNVDHGWLIEGVARWPEVQFTDGMLRRLIQARRLEGMTTADLANCAALPEQTFSALENGNQIPTPATLEKWIACLNLEERFILEGRGRMFKRESRFILIPPGDVEKRSEELKQLREDEDFLKRRIERMAWEIAESKKAHKAGPYHPCILERTRKRAAWND